MRVEHLLSMRSILKRVALFALLGVMVGLGLTASRPEAGFAQAADPRPNILFILTDDMKASDLDYMPNTQSLLANQGVKFTKAWVTRSLCCPSRASTFRGQYAHNHKVWVNVPPLGGFWKFYDTGLESSTTATWLDAAGYDTILIGKYLNRYGLGPQRQLRPNHLRAAGLGQVVRLAGSLPQRHHLRHQRERSDSSLQPLRGT